MAVRMLFWGLLVAFGVTFLTPSVTFADSIPLSNGKALGANSTEHQKNDLSLLLQILRGLRVRGDHGCGRPGNSCNAGKPVTLNVLQDSSGTIVQTSGGTTPIATPAVGFTDPEDLSASSASGAPATAGTLAAVATTTSEETVETETTATVPEPSSVVLLGVGVLGLALRLRRRGGNGLL